MEATITPETQTQEQAPEPPAPILRYATYLHVGFGADTCPLAIALDTHKPGAPLPACEDPAHFHAYCRLPNQFQHEEIRERALAAKARRIRTLRDPDSDANAVMEGDLDELRRADDRQALVDEIVNKDWWKRQLEAHQDVVERDEFEHIQRDRERLAEIDTLDADQRPQDERNELVSHIAAFSEAVDARRTELETPQRDALEGRAFDELLDMVRNDRIDREASQAFMDTYSRHTAFVGTLRPDKNRPHTRIYAEMKDLVGEEVEIVNRLRETFAQLETGARSPNS